MPGFVNTFYLIMSGCVASWEAVFGKCAKAAAGKTVTLVQYEAVRQNMLEMAEDL